MSFDSDLHQFDHLYRIMPMKKKTGSSTRKLKQPQVPPIVSNPVESSTKHVWAGLGGPAKMVCLGWVQKRVILFGGAVTFGITQAVGEVQASGSPVCCFLG
jgi:hypothetical protein